METFEAVRTVLAVRAYQDKALSPETVRRLWDWYGANPYVQGSYFTAMVGRGVAEFLSATGKLSGKALDYGCGCGYGINFLFRKAAVSSFLAVDVSPEAIGYCQRSYPDVADSFRPEATFRNALMLIRLYPGRSITIHNRDRIDAWGTGSRHAASASGDRSRLSRRTPISFSTWTMRTVWTVPSIARRCFWTAAKARTSVSRFSVENGERISCRVPSRSAARANRRGSRLTHAGA